MAIAKSLPPVDSFFLQICPLCGTGQRMMIRGNYLKGEDWQRFPDMGYSFCNCNDIFYTKLENVIDRDSYYWNAKSHTPAAIMRKFVEMESGQEFTISMLDPYFINWNNPHEMWHWQCRKVHILWDMESLAKECEKIGFEIQSCVRDMDVDSKTPQHFHITVRKP